MGGVGPISTSLSRARWLREREAEREREREREREEVGIRHHLPLGRAQSNTKRKVPPFFKIDAYIRVNPTLTD